ncbi:MAG: hypothetical protein ACLFRP_03115 [Puniceicoccaceae bacterium]
MPFHARRTLLASLCLLAAVPLGGQTDEALVLTLDGKRIAGAPEFDRMNIVLDRTTGAPASIHPSTIWHLFMDRPSGDGADGLGTQAVENEPAPVPGVVLTNGAFVAGWPESVTDDAVTIESGRAGELTFPREQVARVQFTFLSGGTRVVLPESATGVVSKSGHFAEGDIISFTEDKVVIDSILGGASTHSTKNLHAVVLAPSPRVSSDYILELEDESLLLADDLSIQADGLRISGLLTGDEEIEASDLARLSAGERRVLDLTDLPYRRRRPEVEGESDLAVRTSPLTAAPIRVDSLGRIVEIPAGNAIASMTGEEMRGFSVRLAVPPGQPPQNRVVFRIRADNLQVYESPPMNSESDPVLVGFRERISRFLVLEVLPADGQTHETPGLWIEPVLHTQ